MQNIDKNKICDSIRKSKPNELLYLTVNSVEKDSLAKALKEIEKFASKCKVDIIILRN